MSCPWITRSRWRTTDWDDSRRRNIDLADSDEGAWSLGLEFASHPVLSQAGIPMNPSGVVYLIVCLGFVAVAAYYCLGSKQSPEDPED
jgi:ureidoglycolate hydrolase